VERSDQPSVSDLARVMRSELRTRRSSRSPVYVWMSDHFDELSEFLTKQRPSWDAIAGALVDLGLTDRSGQKLTAANARRTWWAVRRDVAAIRGPSSAGLSLVRETRREGQDQQQQPPTTDELLARAAAKFGRKT